MITSVGILFAFFPVKFLLKIFLKKYESALIVLTVLFASKSLYVIIQGVYVNLYKSCKQQGKYLIKLILVIGIGATLNYIFYYFLHTKEAFAFATLLTSVIWLVVSVIDFSWLSFTGKEIIYLICCNAAFLFSGIFLESIAGLFVYGTIVTFFSFMLFREEMRVLTFYAKNIVKNKSANNLENRI